uniref:MYND-type domain-containing protein n=1 Tax=Chromera velia CCMP2878 TaxID=1169474 RepID=A0A0G4HVX9_9ALVE|eukprot:Cvel_8955.t1-p1 / transcript=Cvel_8955.t1 / gene=Cvel_8955 / organism=Chromera_velia_CCMP2878 / gene_product=hypothetical protein / transcript_product=hypothetical protein / location=Cvel_scaffold505:6024-7349(+) / protein_length=442 / sequence_SO=supercontig / SO=protein_coding / is_pseudo=false
MFSFPEVKEVTRRTSGGTEFTILVCEDHHLEECPYCCMSFVEPNREAKEEAEEQDRVERSLRCDAPGCSKKGTQKCRSCKEARYCSKECQVSHWSVHKEACKKVKETGLQVNIGMLGEDKIVDVYPIGTRIAIWGLQEQEGHIRKFNVGRGPFKDPLYCVKREGFRKYRDQFDDPSFSCHYLVGMTDGSNEVLEASDVHNSWIAVNQHGVPLHIVEEEKNQTLPSIPEGGIRFPSTPRVLLVSVGVQECFHAEAIRAGIREEHPSIEVDSVDFDRPEVIERVLSGKYSCVVLVGVGQAGPGDMKRYYHLDLRHVLSAWVGAGGVLLLPRGEGCVGKILSDWFGLQWKNSAYQRSDRMGRKRECRSVSPDLLGSFPSSMTVKACFFSGVAREHQVFAETRDRCAVAVAPVGNGKVCLLGDVNASRETVAVVCALAARQNEEAH